MVWLKENHWWTDCCFPNKIDERNISYITPKHYFLNIVFSPLNQSIRKIFDLILKTKSLTTESLMRDVYSASC